MPSLCLCVIVKDEEKLLGDCLSSVVGAVDQIVVCDTGSKDRSVEIALEAGAELVEHPWTGDFAAARNAALAENRCSHVLILDADERLTPGAAQALRQAICNPQLDLGLLPLHNAESMKASVESVLSGEGRRGEAVMLPRLFRVDPTLRWEGVVHESPTTWLQAKKRHAVHVPANILHLGAVPDLRVARDKRARNIELLQTRAVQEPSNPQVWAYLAGELLHAGEEEQAWEAIEQGWSAAETLPSKGRPSLVQLITLRAHMQLSGGVPEQARSTLKQARKWTLAHPNFALLESAAMRVQSPPDLPSAAKLLERCLSWTGALTQEPIPGARGWCAALHLGEVRLAMGDLDEAQIALDRALAECPDLEAAQMAKAELLLRRGHASQALQAIEPYLKIERPDPWLIAAAACSAVGEPLDMMALLRRAAQLQEQGFLAHERKAWMGEVMAEASLYAGTPKAGPGVAGVLGAVAARVPLVDSAPQLPLGVGQIAMNLVRAGRVEVLESFFEARAEALLPGLRERVRAALSSQGVELHEDGEPDFVFIGGAGRSGTTLFRAMLGAHPNLYCGPELKLVPTICSLREQWSRTMGEDLKEAGVSQEMLDDAVRAFVSSLLHGVAPEGERVAEKTPHNLLHMAYLGQLYPRARFVHVVRDGRGVAASLVRQRWIDPASGEPIWYCKDIEGASRYWVEVVAEIRKQAQSVPGRYLELRYEDLVSAPRESMARVLAFLGEPWNEAVLSHQDGAQLSAREASSQAVSGALHLRAVEKWRKQLSPAQLQSLDGRTEAMLLQLGYAC